HVARAREAVQQQQPRRIGRPRFAIEDLETVDIGHAISDRHHENPPLFLASFMTCVVPVSPMSSSSRGWPFRFRPANLPERNGSPPPSSRSPLATHGQG